MAEPGNHSHTVVHGKLTMETIRQAMKQRASHMEKTTRQIVHGAYVSQASVHLYPNNATLSRDVRRQTTNSVEQLQRKPCKI